MLRNKTSTSSGPLDEINFDCFKPTYKSIINRIYSVHRHNTNILQLKSPPVVNNEKLINDDLM